MRQITNRIREDISNLLIGKCDSSKVCHFGFNPYNLLEPLEIKCDYLTNNKVTTGIITFYGCSRDQKN